MASVGKYRKKIKSAKNIAKITKAMQLVAASKMKKAQNMALSGKEYADSVYELTHILSKYLNKNIHPLIKIPEDNKLPELVILVAPEKGLCGGLVTNIGRFAYETLKSFENDTEWIVIGNKAKQLAKSRRPSSAN